MLFIKTPAEKSVKPNCREYAHPGGPVAEPSAGSWTMTCMPMPLSNLHFVVYDLRDLLFDGESGGERVERGRVRFAGIVACLANGCDVSWLK